LKGSIAMRKPGFVAALAMMSMVVHGPRAAGEAPHPLQPLGFLLGEWEASGGGSPGQASGGFTFAAGLQGRVILRTNYADYPATSGKPAFRHDDLMVVYATEAGEIRADYYDSEGHVVRYAGTTPGTGQLTLVSEPATASPRFRLSYRLQPDGTLEGRFEIAAPGEPEAFKPYLSWTARRKVAGK
jgi:hypothetical protein